MLQGGAHGLASDVRVRLPSASSAPLKRAQSVSSLLHHLLILHSRVAAQRAREPLLFRSCSSSTARHGGLKSRFQNIGRAATGHLRARCPPSTLYLQSIQVRHE
eukprot:2136049-Prymnesium_polylepis.1